MLVLWWLQLSLFFPVSASLSERSLDSVGRRHLLLPSAKTLVATAKKQPLCWTLCGWNLAPISLWSAWEQRWPAVWQWPGLLLAAPWFQPCSDALWKLCPTLCLPTSHQGQPWGKLKSWIWWLMCLSEMLTPPSLRKHKNRHAPRPWLVPYDKLLTLQQAGERFLYLALEFHWLHLFTRCCVVNLLFAPPGWRWANPWEKVALGKWSWPRLWGLTKTGPKRQWPWQWRCWKVRKLGD